jgi:hypothetical protein
MSWYDGGIIISFITAEIEEGTYPDVGAAAHERRFPLAGGEKATTIPVETDARVNNKSRTEYMVVALLSIRL